MSIGYIIRAWSIQSRLYNIFKFRSFAFSLFFCFILLRIHDILNFSHLLNKRCRYDKSGWEYWALWTLKILILWLSCIKIITGWRFYRTFFQDAKWLLSDKMNCLIGYEEKFFLNPKHSVILPWLGSCGNPHFILSINNFPFS